jgi:hypothetical protein
MTIRQIGKLSVVFWLMAIVSLNAHASALFNPNQFVGASSSFYEYNASINFDTSQVDRSLTIKSYSVDLPAGWHIAHESIDPSTVTSCKDLNDAELAAERIGYTQLTLHNDDTRGRSGPIPFSGFLYFLSSNPLTDTATLCSVMTTTSSLIPVGNRDIMFQILLRYNTSSGGTLKWDYAAVPGAPAGTRSILDNTYYLAKNTSILYTRIELNTLTKGNYNTDGSDKKAAVRFVWNPSTPGNYTFTGTYTPCGSGESGNCSPDADPAIRTTVVRITDYPTGFHPGAVLTAPGLWDILRGPNPISIKWQQPSKTSPTDPIKGYVINLTADYVADSSATLYLITDKSNVNFSSSAPCGPDGMLPECALAFSLPYTSDSGKLISAENNFSLTLVALFKDGHRSDGLCDDGTAVGVVAPCADGTVPYASSSGVARTQFMHRVKAWPLVYRQIVNARPGYGAWQIFVLLVDLEAHEFQFVTWKPAPTTYGGGGIESVVGSNSAGGAIAFQQLSGPQHWLVDAVLTPSSATGLWVLTSSTNEFQNSYQFNMSKI